MEFVNSAVKPYNWSTCEETKCSSYAETEIKKGLKCMKQNLDDKILLINFDAILFLHVHFKVDEEINGNKTHLAADKCVWNV